MTIDIKNSTATQVLIRLASSNQKDLQDASIQASTMQRYQDFAGYASEGSVEKLLSFTSTIEISETYIKSNEVVNSRVKTMESTIRSLSDVAAEASQLIASRQNGATGTDVPLDVLGQSMLNEIAALLNTQFDGAYLFAGSKTDTKPVTNIQTANLDNSDASTSSYYQGNSDTLSINVSDSQELEYGITANNEGFQQLIGSIHLAIEGHTNDNTDTIANAMTMVTDAVDRIGTLIATAGASREILEKSIITHNSVLTLTTENLTEVVGGTALITEASVRIAELEATIQATYLSFSRLNGLRLSNFL